MGVAVPSVTMQCPVARGRRVANATVLRLVGAAAGRCEKPDCPNGFLWHALPDGGAVRLAEVAHIVAASDAGPRGNESVPDEKLVAFNNLILLCPTCHTTVDGAPDHFPLGMLNRWKSQHEGRLDALLDVQVYETRVQARMQLGRWLSQNRAVWELYGPESDNSTDPETGGTWIREVKEVVMPNNTRIAALAEANAHLLRESEHQVIAMFEAHRRALEARQLGVDVGVAAPRFPPGMHNLFAD